MNIDELPLAPNKINFLILQGTRPVNYNIQLQNGFALHFHGI